jgi:hypothetical protein
MNGGGNSIKISFFCADASVLMDAVVCLSVGTREREGGGESFFMGTRNGTFQPDRPIAIV